MRVGFVVIQRPTDIEIQTSVPDNNAQNALVTYARVGNSFALFIGRLYYQYEMLTRLASQCPPDLLREWKSNDAALALAVYRHLGLASLERLEGDFALVIWDSELTQLIGLRDPLGGYPLFWAQYENAIAFSTSIRPLCAMQTQCFLNEEYFAEFIMLQAPRSEGNNELCVYKGIHRTLPGTIVVAKGPAAGIERHVHWDWLKQIKDPGTNEITELAEQCRNLLQLAVQERFRGRTLAHLSGGMDSTSVALLAQHAVHSGVGEAPMHTASLVYSRLPLLSRERPYIESALQWEPEIVAHLLPADNLLEFDSFANPPLHDEPFTALSSLATQQSIVSLAAEIGASTILTGIGADEIYHLLPHFLADSLRHGHFRKSWQEATRWAKAQNCSPWNILRIFGIDPIASKWIAGTRWASLLWSKGIDWRIPSWILPDFARRYALRDRAIENARQAYCLHEQTSLSVILSCITDRAGDMLRWSVAAPLGIAIAHPFLDPRLLSFGLGMLSRLQPEPARTKPVLAEAMRGVLPDKIIYRQRKGHFNEVYYLGLARNLHRLETMIRSAPIDGVINKDALIDILREGSLAGVPVRQLQHANYMLSLLKWLCMQDNWLHTENTPVEVIHVPLSKETISS